MKTYNKPIIETIVFGLTDIVLSSTFNVDGNHDLTDGSVNENV